MCLDYGFALIGFALILGALFGTKFSYGGDEYGNGSRPAPAFVAKVIFFVVGSIFLLLGLLDLFGVIALTTDG